VKATELSHQKTHPKHKLKQARRGRTSKQGVCIRNKGMWGCWKEQTKSQPL